MGTRLPPKKIQNEARDLRHTIQGHFNNGCFLSLSLGDSGHPFAWNDIYVPVCRHSHSHGLVYGRSIKEDKKVLVRRRSGAILYLRALQ